jgi:site-specific DNA-cytosine methylase|tara:strand:+ start:70 stop:660 length:591 start_codon:yes stop_codon:yes gene_type:complete
MQQNKIILDLCGGTGSWSKLYSDNGYDVRVITLPKHDVRTYKPPENVYGILAAPPCDQFSFAKTTGKPRDLKSAWSIVRGCLDIIAKCNQIKIPYAKTTTLKFWCIENPHGLLKRFLGKPCYQFNPYDFGDDYKKLTHLWGWFNEPIKNPIKCNKPKFDRMKSKDIHPEHFGKYTRQERRAITPEGFAQAFYEANK